MKSKKGIQLEHAGMAVITLVLVATLVIIAIYMFSSLSIAVPYSRTTLNETSFINNTGDTLTNSSNCGFANLGISSVYNGSTLLLAANYTLVNNKLYNATTINYNSVNATYTYTDGGPGCTASNSLISNFSNYPALVGLVGTIIFLGLVIGILVLSFGFRKNTA